MFLELDKIDPNPGAPFKFNQGWDSDEEFQDLVRENLLRYDPSQEGNSYEKIVEALK